MNALPMKGYEQDFGCAGVGEKVIPTSKYRRSRLPRRSSVQDYRMYLGEQTVAVSVITQSTGVADAIEQTRLDLAAGDAVVRVTRIRSEGCRPTAYELAVLPLGRFPGLKSDSEITHDLLALASAHGLALGRVTEGLDTVSPTSEVAEHLEIGPDEAVIKLDRVVRSAHGLPIEWRIAFVLKL
jgi:DNA-binding GntR family transcriptional regulator